MSDVLDLKAPTPTGTIVTNPPYGERIGEAEELVGTVLFLASEKASSFVTGADIRVDGGFLCQTI